MQKRYELARLDELVPLACPCGTTRRAFTESANAPASVHLVQISDNALPHYHKRTTEIYLVLETDGEACVELDGEPVAVRPMSTILIHPGCRHRAVGNMKIANIAIPQFDPEDEWFD